MNDSLDILTQKLITDLSRISSHQKGHVEYELEQGEALAWTLKSNKHIHVMDSFIEAGTMFPLHRHEGSAEIIVLYKGDISLVCEGCEQEAKHEQLKIGIPVYIPADMNHFIHARENSWVIAITIPPDSNMLK